LCNEIIRGSDYKERVSEVNIKACRKKKVTFKKESELKLEQELLRHKVHGRKLIKLV